MTPRFLQKSTKSAEHSFSCNYAEVINDNGEFHYHKEFEIIFTLHNTGTRFVGDNIDSFGDNDLVLIGPGLPHCWQSNKEYRDSHSDANSIIIHFEKDFVGTEFFDIPEMKKVKNMLANAERGLHFPTADALRLKEQFKEMIGKTSWLQVVDLLAILCQMAECNYTQLASEGFSNSYHHSYNEKKITSIYNYLIQNHYKDITLEDVANFANMNPSAFCRYFKKVTSKTFSDSMNQIRVGTACKKLIDTELTIAEIGYICGYQSISYFNRQFKKVKKISPSEYRMKYMLHNDFVTS